MKTREFEEYPMAQDTEGLKLAAEFPAATQADWLEKVDVALKGAPRKTCQQNL